MKNKKLCIARDILLVLAAIVFMVLVICFKERNAIQQLICFVLILLFLFLAMLLQIKITFIEKNVEAKDNKDKNNGRKIND